MKKALTLADARDAYNFTAGMPMVMTDSGDVRLATRAERLSMAFTGWLQRWTRWFRPRTVCAAIDVDAGCITMAIERWSWRRWRWERA